MSDDQRAKIAAGNSKALKAKWADPASREIMLAGCRRSWKHGGRARDKIIWTKEMDGLIRSLYYRFGFAFVRTEGAKKIGVSERSIRTRLRYLGLAGKGDLICDNWDYYDA